MPTLKLIDAREVTSDERERCDLVFSAEPRGGVLQDSRLLATKVRLYRMVR